MPANERALRATNVYREHIATLRAHAEGVTRRTWRLVGPDLDATYPAFADRTAAALRQMQITGARLSHGYLASYIAVSLGQHPTVSGASANDPRVGTSRAGKPLADALTAPLITVKTAIGSGHDFPEALAMGVHQAARNASEDIAFVARGALFDGIRDRQEIVGWRRVTNGGCGACLALADGTILADDSDIEVHDNCQCSAEPVVRDVPDDIQRPTGRDMFEALTVEQQDHLLGPDKAKLIRDGDAPFHALVARSPMDAIPDQITEAPLEALHAN